ncbi:MAG: hypothetical protein JO022_14415, partial [Acidobacteriaceae bacterium]|nr:hypothetical protein [Acidobacteriaceae bacterium]
FGSHGDLDPWHGWLFAYSANDLSQSPAVFNATPNGGGGSFWQAGRGLAEAGGLIYAGSANGDYDGHTNVANSFLQLSPTLKVLDWYTPDDWQMLSDHDNDVASGGSALLPGSDLLIGGDKFGTLYLMHQHAMANLVQTFTVAEQSGIFNFAVWPVSSGPLLYIQVQGDVLRSYSLANGQLNEQPFAMSNVYSDIPYQGIAVSSNGPDGGVVWLTSGDHSQPGVPGTLHALDAQTLQELWNSDMAPDRDRLGAFAKFVTPTVADGKVFVPTFSGHVSIYGPIPATGDAAPTVWNAANAASFVGDAVSPGEQVVLSGSGLDSAGGDLAVLFDGVAATVLYSFPGVVAVITPAQFAAGTTSIRVQTDGAFSNSLTIPVAAATPGIYTADGSGGGLAQAYNDDGSENSETNPAAIGSAILLLVNGAGAVDSDGVPVNPPNVFVGGVPAQIVSAASASDINAGAIQVLVMIPDTIPTGDNDVVVTVAGSISQAGVWISVI